MPAPSATPIEVPYSGAVPTTSPIAWYRFTLSTAAMKLQLSTLASPPGTDTFLAVFNDAGAMLGMNEDWTPEDVRSRVDLPNVAPGTYYVAVAMYPGSASAPWVVGGGPDNIPAGTWLNVLPTLPPPPPGPPVRVHSDFSGALNAPVDSTALDVTGGSGQSVFWVAATGGGGAPKVLFTGTGEALMQGGAA